MIKVIVTGANGQLGQCLKKVSPLYNDISFNFLNSQQFNLLDEEQMKGVIQSIAPDYIINCAAFTAVDLAEDNSNTAFQINETGAGTLAKLCSKLQVKLIHISTDFVFSGTNCRPLNELDKANPIGVYGKSKLAGEEVIAVNLSEHIIIRTSWLYSEFGNNFVKTMLRLGHERSELGVVIDQLGSPTYAVDLASAICQIILSPNKQYGVYHFSNEGVASWYDLAIMAIRQKGLGAVVLPITSEQYPTKAVRPSYSVLDKTKIKETYNLSIRHWMAALHECLNEID